VAETHDSGASARLADLPAVALSFEPVVVSPAAGDEGDYSARMVSTATPPSIDSLSRAAQPVSVSTVARWTRAM